MLGGQLGILVGEDIAADLQDGLAALAGHDPAQEHQVLQIVELQTKEMKRQTKYLIP